MIRLEIAATHIALLLVATLLTPLDLRAGSPQSPLHGVIEAHGGMETWQTFATFTYTLDGFPLSEQVARPNTSTVDLRTRRNRIEGQGWTVGFDGSTAWSLPAKDAAGLPTRFFNLGSFYFIGMPYVFADPGVSVREIEPQSFRGREYRVLTVSYEEGVGYSDEDEYHLFIDPETDLLAVIHHSVTETGIDRVTWTFDTWQRIGGVLVPETMTFHAGWNPDNPGDGATFTVRDASLSTTTPVDAFYAPPEGAWTDF